jgi:hypothetical protein
MHDGVEELWIGAESLRAPTPPPDNWDDVRPLLRSIFRPATYGSLLRPGEPVAWRQTPTSLVHELVAVDMPEARAIVTVENTNQWGVTWNDLITAARENIARRHPVTPWMPGTQGVYVDEDQSSYITSAITTPGWLGAFTSPHGHRPIAFIPNEDTLIIGYDDPDQGAKYFEMAEQMYCESERHVSPEAFTVHGGLVVPFDKAGPHPLRDLALRARTCAAVRQYAEQAEFLKQLYHEELTDVFVAETMTFDAGHGQRTGAAWGEGITIDLPEVDYICFVNYTTRFFVPFAVVVDVVGIQPTPGYFPPRYRVSGWPEPKLMDILRFHALPEPPSATSAS